MAKRTTRKTSKKRSRTINMNVGRGKKRKTTGKIKRKIRTWRF